MGVDTIKNGFIYIRDFWVNLSRPNKIKLIAIAAVVAIAIGVAVYLLTARSYTHLIDVTDPNEATSVTTALTESNIVYKTQGNGIWVDSRQYEQAYFQLVSTGIPQSGVNYSLITDTSFGQTESDKKRRSQLLQNELITNGLKRLEQVEDALVIINEPETSSFILRRDQKPPTASVMLALNPMKPLNAASIKGIESYIMGAVNGLTVENIQIIDQNGNKLNAGEPAGSVSEMVTTQLDVERRITDFLTEQTSPTLDKMYGTGNYTLNFNVRVDLEQSVTESETFEAPNADTGIVRRSTNSSETMTGTQNAAGAGLDPNAVAQTYQAGGETGNYESSNKVVDYELNRILTSIKAGPMKIRDISGAVVVDSKVAEDRSLPTDTTVLTTIIANATGIPTESIVAQFQPLEGIRIAQEEQDAIKAAVEAARRGELIRSIITYGSSALILIVLMVLAYLALTARERLERKALEMAQADLAAVDYMGPDVISGFEAFVGDDEHNPLDEDNVDSIRKHIEDFVRKDPESVANLLKVWLYEGEEY